MVLRDAAGNILDEINEVGFRTKGNVSRVLPQIDDAFYKAHFKIKFDKTFDQPADGDACHAIQNIHDASASGTGEWFSWTRFPLVDKVFEIPAYKNRYLNYLATFTGTLNKQEPEYGIFSYSNFELFHARLYNVYGKAGSDYLSNDTANSDALCNMNEETTSQWEGPDRPATVEEYIERRINSVRQQLRDKGIN